MTRPTNGSARRPRRPPVRVEVTTERELASPGSRSTGGWAGSAQQHSRRGRPAGADFGDDTGGHGSLTGWVGASARRQLGRLGQLDHVGRRAAAVIVGLPAQQYHQPSALRPILAIGLDHDSKVATLRFGVDGRGTWRPRRDRRTVAAGGLVVVPRRPFHALPRPLRYPQRAQAEQPAWLVEPVEVLRAVRAGDSGSTSARRSVPTRHQRSASRRSPPQLPRSLCAACILVPISQRAPSLSSIETMPTACGGWLNEPPLTRATRARHTATRSGRGAPVHSKHPRPGTARPRPGSSPPILPRQLSSDICRSFRAAPDGLAVRSRRYPSTQISRAITIRLTTTRGVIEPAMRLPESD